MKKEITLIIALILSTSLAFAHGDEHKASENPIKLMADASPMPILMPILKKKSKELGLSKEQDTAFTKWRTANMAPAVVAASTVAQGEKDIKQAVLDGKPQVEIEALLKKVTDARTDIANRSLRCALNAQKILTPSQWQKVVGFYKGQSAEVNKKQKMKAMMKHVSPMPSYMSVVMKNTEKLKLSKKQLESLMQEKKARKAQVKPLMQEIHADEEQLYLASLHGKSKTEIEKMTHETMHKRMAVVDAKTDCRDTIHEILNAEQWQVLLELFHDQ